MATPLPYDEATGNLICEALADGLSLRGLCQQDGMPSTSTVCKWLANNPGFAEQYARARELQADALFDDCLAITDGAHPLAESDIQARRLQVDTRKWMAGKLKGKYSDKVKHVGGDDGDNPIAFTGFDVRFV